MEFLILFIIFGGFSVLMFIIFGFVAVSFITRKEKWAALAQRWQLNYDHPFLGHPDVRGILQGREVQIQERPESISRENGNKKTTYVSMRVKHLRPYQELPAFKLEARTMLHKLTDALGGKRKAAPLSDAMLQERFILMSAAPGIMDATVSHPPLKEALLRIFFPSHLQIPGLPDEPVHNRLRAFNVTLHHVEVILAIPGERGSYVAEAGRLDPYINYIMALSIEIDEALQSALNGPTPSVR